MPATVLLRHQPALQLVGQAGDHRGQGGQLLVQKSAQPLQFIGVAQVGGVDDLVIGGGEDAVGVDGPAVVGRLLAVGQGAFVDVRPIVRGFPVRIARRAVRPGIALVPLALVVGRAVHGLAFATARVVLLVLLVSGVGRLGISVVLALLIRCVVAPPVARIEVQRAQYVLQPVCERDLVIRHLGQGVEFGAGLVLHGRADQIQHGGGPVRRALAGQPLAHQQGHGLGHRHPLRLGRAQGAHLLQPGQQRRAHIGPHPGQRLRTDRLDPRLLNGLEHLGGAAIQRPQAGVQGLVMIGQTQRQPVGLTAQGGAFGPAGVTRRMRQGQDAVRQLRPVGAEHDLQLRLLRQRPRRMGEGALEDVCRGLGGGHGFP